MYELVIEVKEIQGPEKCGALHRVGDKFIYREMNLYPISGHRGICVFAFSAMLPFILGVAREIKDKKDWIVMKPMLEAFEKGYVRCPDKDVGVIFSMKRRKIKDSEIPWTHDEKGNYQLREDADYYNPFIPIHETSESETKSED